MPTFLPFLRAVKAPARSIGVYALIAGLAAPAVSCVTHAGSRSKGPPTGPLPTRKATQQASLAPPIADSDAGSASADAAARPPTAPYAPTAPGAPAAPSPIQLELELPYAIDARPRAAGAQQAAADDEQLARWNVGGSSDPSSPSSQASFHPGTRVVVDTRPAKLRAGATRRSPTHGLTFDRVQAQARSKGYWPFRICFEAGQREKKGAGGETRVAFSIGKAGNVRAARLLDSKLGNAMSAACLVHEVRKLHFAPPPAVVMPMVASIRIYPGDVDLPALASEAAVAAAPSKPGAFDALAVRARVAEQRSELEACFTGARRADPALWGRLALAVILEMDGSVHRVSEVESHFPGASATHCAQVLLSQLVFPSVNGKPYTFVIPMRLSPSASDAASPDLDPSPPGAASPDLNPSPPDAPNSDHAGDD